MPSLGRGLGLTFLRVLEAASGVVFPSEVKLKDTDSSDWYAITLEPNVGSTGFYLDWTGPVSAGSVPEWVFLADDGKKYKWVMQVLDGVLQLNCLGETTDAVTVVQIRSSNGANRNIVCKFDGGPYLDFEP